MTPATRSLVATKIRRIYPDRDVDDVLATLDRYGAEEPGRENHRVHLAILKLCDEGDVADPAAYVDVAKIDYRDALAWAEYPNEIRSTGNAGPEEKEKLRKLDRAQYEEWLFKI